MCVYLMICCLDTVITGKDECIADDKPKLRVTRRDITLPFHLRRTHLIFTCVARNASNDCKAQLHGGRVRDGAHGKHKRRSRILRNDGGRPAESEIYEAETAS